MSTRVKQKARRPGGSHEIADRPFTIKLPQWAKPNSPTQDSTVSPAGIQCTDLSPAAEVFEKDAERCLFPGISPIESTAASSSDGECTTIRKEIADDENRVKPELMSANHLQDRFADTGVEEPFLYVPDSQAHQTSASLSVGLKAITVTQMSSISFGGYHGHKDAALPKDIVTTTHTNEDLLQRNGGPSGIEKMAVDSFETEPEDHEKMDRTEQPGDFNKDHPNDGERHNPSKGMGMVRAASSEVEPQISNAAPRKTKSSEDKIDKKDRSERAEYSSSKESKEEESRLGSYRRERDEDRNIGQADEQLSEYHRDSELDESISKMKVSQRIKGTKSLNTSATAKPKATKKQNSRRSEDDSSDEDQERRMCFDSRGHSRAGKRDMERTEVADEIRESSTEIASGSSPEVEIAPKKAKKTIRKTKSGDTHCVGVKVKTKIAKTKKVESDSGDEEPEIGMDVDDEIGQKPAAQRKTERVHSDSDVDESGKAAPSKSKKGSQKSKSIKKPVTNREADTKDSKKKSSRKFEDCSSDEEKESRMDFEGRERKRTSDEHMNVDQAEELPIEHNSDSEPDDPSGKPGSPKSSKGQKGKGKEKSDKRTNTNRKTARKLGDSSDVESRKVEIHEKVLPQCKRSKQNSVTEDSSIEENECREEPTKQKRASGKEPAAKGKRKRSGQDASDRDDKSVESKKCLSPCKNYWKIQRCEDESNPRLRTRAEFRKQGMEPKVRMRWGGGTVVYDVEASK
ncbi:hypothetical protein BJ742DRAFT_744547 [Cladochytrium replicatum]|nr:hypothetical protein BJ742DRAFT_744547 [Cladochytrium replicatum]